MRYHKHKEYEPSFLKIFDSENSKWWYWKSHHPNEICKLCPIKSYFDESHVREYCSICQKQGKDKVFDYAKKAEEGIYSNSLPYFLDKGYRSIHDKLMFMFFDGQDLVPERKVFIAKYRKSLFFQKNQNGKKEIRSKRIMNNKRYCEVIYKSGNKEKSRIFIGKTLTVIEPIYGGLAAYIILSKDANQPIIDLKIINHFRVIHNWFGKILLESALEDK